MFLHRTAKKQQALTLIEVMVSFFLFALVISGLITGYVQSNRMATWSSWSLAAQSVASQGAEQARAAQWDELGTTDEWPPMTNAMGAIIATNFICSLDVPSSGALIYVTNRVTISTYIKMPPVRQIRSDCIWHFPMTDTVFTNSVITLRAPDQ
jgi:hypothetical protein